MMWLVVWLLGCSDSDEAPNTLDTLASVDDTDTPNVDEFVITSVYTPEEVFEELNNLLLYGLPNPYDIFDAYMTLYDEGATPSCPGTNYNFNSQEVDNAGCTTPDGYFFAGLGEVRLRDNEQDLHCDCRIVTPDGRMIRGAGNIFISERDGETFMDIQGSFLRINTDTTNTWLDQLPSTNLSIIIQDANTEIAGGYTLNGQAVYFEQLKLVSCDIRSGSIFFRDPSGGWWSWMLDGSCDYGILSFQDSVIGSYRWDTTQIDELLNAIGDSQ